MTNGVAKGKLAYNKLNVMVFTNTTLMRYKLWGGTRILKTLR